MIEERQPFSRLSTYLRFWTCIYDNQWWNLLLAIHNHSEQYTSGLSHQVNVLHSWFVKWSSGHRRRNIFLNIVELSEHCPILLCRSSIGRGLEWCRYASPPNFGYWGIKEVCGGHCEKMAYLLLLSSARALYFLQDGWIILWDSEWGFSRVKYLPPQFQWSISASCTAATEINGIVRVAIQSLSMGILWFDVSEDSSKCMLTIILSNAPVVDLTGYISRSEGAY